MKIILWKALLIATWFFSYASYAIDCSSLAVWQSDQAYVGGMQVQFNGNGYTANYWTRDNNPETHSSNPWDHWRLDGACEGGGEPPENQSPVVNANGPYAGETNVAINFSSAGSSDTDGFIESYSWDFGDGNSSIDANPVHVYANAGNFVVTLTVTDNEGTSSVETTTANVTDGSSQPPGSCDGLPMYSPGTSYGAGERVFNLRDSDSKNIIYVCVIPGWCSLNSPFYYEPGNGTAWDDAWDEEGPCTGGGAPNNPVAMANGPYRGTAGNAINFSSAGSFDPDGEITSYLWDFGDGATSNDANARHIYNIEGSYTVTLTVTDNDGRSASESTVAVISEQGDPGELPARIINGYWHNFENGSGIIRLRDVSTAFNVINVSFAEPTTSTSGIMEFTLDPLLNEEEFRNDIAFVKSRGQKVLISIGGAEGQVRLTTQTARDNFVATMIDIIEDYGFEGIDIDFEGQSLSLDLGDTDFRNPTTPLIVNTISAVREITDYFGPEFILTMAPETFFVQLGYTFYGGISAGADRRAGAYLPIIHALRDRLTFLQVQNYNSGPITGLDDQFHTMGSADFHVAMIDMLLKGFPITGDTTKFFPPLRQDQVLLGLPAYVQAGGGFTQVSEVHKALDCLIKSTNCDGIYNPGTQYPNMRGLMTWSINWDRFGGFNFSTPHRAYLDALPQ